MTAAIVLGSLFAWPAHAVGKAYDLSVRLTRDGKSLTASHLRVHEGEVRNVNTGRGDFVEVRVTEGEDRGRAGISMEFSVGTRAADGRRLVLSRPRIIAVENEPATITVGDGGQKTISLSAIARRTLRQEIR